MKLKFTEHQKKYMTKGAQFWVQTLYDNELDQCKYTLQKEDAYCCLGVGALCHQLKTGEDLLENNLGEYAGGTLVEHIKTVQWLGLISDAGCTNGNQDALYRLNDCDNYSFKQIAQVLLDNPEQYFVEVKK